MYILLMIVHVVVCLFLIIVVLLQSGKAADLAGAFGGMGSQTAFGPRGSATLLSQGDDDFGGAVHGHVAFAFDFGIEERGSGDDGAGGCAAEAAPAKSRRRLRYRSLRRRRAGIRCSFQCRAAHRLRRRSKSTEMRRWRNWQTH